MPERGDKRDAFSLAASLTDLSVEYIDGVSGEKIPTKALPVGQEERKMPNNTLGSWRAHMDAIRMVVEKGYSSALILEDDADWDIRIKAQLNEFARGSRFLLGNTTSANTHSPYGDGWDVLWVGLCHDSLPEDDLRVYVVTNDQSVPLVKHLLMNNPEMLEAYPPHSRIIHMAGGPICTYAYAVSLRGAQKILYALSVKELRGIFDNALAWWCQKNDQAGLCISANPTYFYSHLFAGGAGKSSDINVAGPKFDKAETKNIRWSTRLNIEKMLRGESNYIDSYPDEAEGRAEIAREEEKERQEKAAKEKEKEPEVVELEVG